MFDSNYIQPLGNIYLINSTQTNLNLKIINIQYVSLRGGRFKYTNVNMPRLFNLKELIDLENFEDIGIYSDIIIYVRMDK